MSQVSLAANQATLIGKPTQREFFVTFSGEWMRPTKELLMNFPPYETSLSRLNVTSTASDLMGNEMEMRMAKNLPVTALLVTVISIGALMQIYPSQAKAEPTAPNIEIDGTFIVDNDIEILNSTSTDSVETDYGTTANGTPVIITKISAPPSVTSPPDEADLELTQKETIGESLPVPEIITDTGVVNSSPLPDAEAKYEPVVIYAATSSTATISWPRDGERSSYTVTRQDGSSENLQENQFHESGLTPGSAYNYTIGDSSGKTRNVIISTPPSDWNGIDEIQLANIEYSSYLHRTFIPGQHAPTDWLIDLGCNTWPIADTSFGGDNREFQLPSGNNHMTPPSRSSVYIEALWQNGEALARPGWSMSVSPTRLYSGGNLVDELWAGLSGINISGGVGPNNSFAYANISHVVANPYCVGGQIAYQVNAAFWPTGYTEVNGTRLPVPNHEGYIRTSLNGANWNAWSTVHQMTNQGFHCLLGTCGFETISFGGYPS